MNSVLTSRLPIQTGLLSETEHIECLINKSLADTNGALILWRTLFSAAKEHIFFDSSKLF